MRPMAYRLPLLQTFKYLDQLPLAPASVGNQWHHSRPDSARNRMRRAVSLRSPAFRILPALVVVAMAGLQGCANNDPLAPGSGTSALPAGPAFSLVPAPTITTNTNVWTTQAPMPTPRTAAATELVSSLIYVMGGWDGVGASNKVEAFNRSTNSWITKPVLPQARYEGNGAAEMGG